MEELVNIETWIRLAHAKGIGASTRHSLLQHFLTASGVLAATDQQLLHLGLNEKQRDAIQFARRCPWLTELTERTLQWLEHPDHHCIVLGSAHYPPKLASIASPPPLLYVSGDLDLLSQPGVGIVGSRQSAPPTLSSTAGIAAKLASAGLVITSGMALGVDQAAHHAALEVDGMTMAVAGTGLDRVYPARHRHLAQAIAEHGALISEFPLGASPQPHHFPRRNRIISGLSLGVVVIEATLKSGTLTTARHAMEQGREVMVLPGSINNPLSKGCHALIKSGATLVETAEDILAEIAPQIDTTTLKTAGSSRQVTDRQSAECDNSHAFLHAMGYDAIGVDMLAERLKAPVASVLATLVTLELSGQIARTPGGRYIRC